MCGIVGFVDNRKKAEKNKILDKMLDRIIHRGPDDSGRLVDNTVALGHRRLSIIDLNTGGQPIFNEKEEKAIIFNGEIYNYKELKKDLIEKGHVFKTNTDTEVILHGYEEYKEDILNKLRGMFTFVIYNKKTKELFGARDHFGIKPFYYYQTDDTFMFSSEIKAFLEHPDFKKELNKDVIPMYLRFNFTPTDETFFENVFKLKPGHYFKYKNGKFSIKRYFYMTFDEKEYDYKEIVERISNTIKDSVNKHMISDVEVGSFLSSGIDSSYLVSLARPDKTYTVGYDIEKYNEINYAKDLANKLKINNTSKKISKQEYFDSLEKVIYHMDEPLADPAAIALYFVAQLASKDVKVVLSGEGADEFFGGYNTYKSMKDASWYFKIPYPIRHLISKVASLLPEKRGINFLVRNGQKLEDYYIGVNHVFNERDTKKIVKCKTKTITNKDITSPIFNEYKDKSDIIKMQAVDINLWLANDIFEKADKMTMAHSIEGRVPFSDIEVFNLARTLSYKDKINKNTTKVALRDAAKKVIPNESYKKKKLGFPVPLREWIKEEDIYNKIKKSFNSNIAIELFDTKRLNKLLDDHKDNKCDNYKKIWTVYTILLWYHVYFEEQV